MDGVETPLSLHFFPRGLRGRREEGAKEDEECAHLYPIPPSVLVSLKGPRTHFACDSKETCMRSHSSSPSRLLVSFFSLAKASTLARACMLRNKLARGNNCAETMPRIKLPGPGYIKQTAACMQVESLHVKLTMARGGVEIRKMNARTLLVC